MMQIDKFKHLKILYVDDDKENLTSFRIFFRRYYEVDTASSAKEALEMMKNKTYDILITDHMMPETNGVDLLEIVNENNYRIIRMLLTGYFDPEIFVDAVNRGRVQAIILKPYDVNKVCEKINKTYMYYNDIYSIGVGGE